MATKSSPAPGLVRAYWVIPRMSHSFAVWSLRSESFETDPVSMLSFSLTTITTASYEPSVNVYLFPTEWSRLVHERVRTRECQVHGLEGKMSDEIEAFRHTIHSRARQLKACDTRPGAPPEGRILRRCFWLLSRCGSIREECNLQSAMSSGLQIVCEEVAPPLLNQTTLVRGFDFVWLSQL